MAEGGSDDADGLRDVNDTNETGVDKFESDLVEGKGNAANCDDIFAEPDLCIGSKIDKSRTSHTDEGVGEKSKREENPFSFKQFLKKDGAVGGSQMGTVSNVKSLKMSRDADSSRCLEQCPVPCGYSTGLGLPDFVQDHILASELHTHNTTRLDVDNLPDFTFNNNNNNHTFHETGPPKKAAKVQNRNVHDVSCKSKKIHDNCVPSGENTFSNSLPDFLSDGPMLGNHDFGSAAKSSNSPTMKSGEIATDGRHTSSNIEQLKAENESLSRQLKDARELLSTESKRVTRMQAELKSCRKKEAEETAALEKMVQQVEANLHNSTQRAATAEATVTKLKHEIKILEDRLSSLMLENVALNGGENCVANMKEKAKMASDQITSAATSAEQTLRQLLGGVESLKIIAACLADIDKISEDTSAGGDKM